MIKKQHHEKSIWIQIIEFALIRTMPVLFGYLFMGMAFGLLLQRAGYNFVWAFLCSVLIYAGSMQFVLVGFFSGGLSILSIILMTFTINSRHMFYGLSFIEKFKSMGKRYPYMIFSLTDETYSVLCGTQVPEGMDEKKLFFTLAILDQSYWILGSVIGSVAGNLIQLNTKGIDFTMTALFVVIFIEQWMAAKTHLPAVLGLIVGLICLLIFGASKFILPALFGTVFLLMILKKQIQGVQKEGESK